MRSDASLHGDVDDDRCVCNISMRLQRNIHIMYLYIYMCVCVCVYNILCTLYSNAIQQYKAPGHENVKFNDFMLSRARRPEKYTRSD